jgi:hypothetical protein
MMTEIGLAQQRLFDDEASSVAQRLPSTASPYSSEISQPGPFPTMPNYPYQQTNEAANDASNSAKKVVYPSYEATQLVPSVQSVQALGYEYSTPAVSTTVDSPGGYGETISYPTTIHTTDGSRAHPSQKATQRAKSLQSQPYSPHDTEPLSSVASPGLNRAKSDNVRSGLMSPRYSEPDAHDELSLPAVSVQVTTVKQRGPPKKQPVQENDDDDELAIVESGSGQSKPQKRKPGRPPKAAANGDAAMNNAVAVGAENPSADVTTTEQLEAPVKSAAKETKKRKIRRSKTADTLMQKTRATGDDDLIWLDSRPIQVPANDQTNTKPPIPESTKQDPPSAEAPTEDNPQTSHPEARPAPKKRGRKRKTASEQPTGAEASENQAPETPAPDTPGKTTEPVPDPQSPSKPASTEQIPQPDAPAEEPTEPLPQTPQDPKIRKGPAHSPISSTSKVPYRVGLSKRARIAPLLKVVRK